MTVTTQAKIVNKRSKKKINTSHKENKPSIEVKKEEQTTSSLTSSPVTDLSKNDTKEGTFIDPAIVATGKCRRQPLSKRHDAANVISIPTSTSPKDDTEKVNANPAPLIRTRKVSVSDKSPALVNKAARILRKPRPSHQSSVSRTSKKAVHEEEEGSTASAREERNDVPTAATPPRFRGSKASRERTTSVSTKANESLESNVSHHDDKARSVRFFTEPDQTINKQAAGKEEDVRSSTRDVFAQAAAINDAATLLAQSGLSHSSLYPNLLVNSTLAKQQLASAQVLAQLRASVEGLKVLSSK
ncbi:hypothetical protein CBS101457_002241 [Exobasidium rhododendri]|nr:hypothetical protein CBS101457_002241 [Exobasidium rhododendri]